jgi:hypothetical protein
MYYNCNQEKDFAAITGLKKLGVYNIPPLVGRGVLINIAKYFKTDVMKAGQYFNEKEIQEAASQQGVAIREGDVVLLSHWLDRRQTPISPQSVDKW